MLGYLVEERIRLCSEHAVPRFGECETDMKRPYAPDVAERETADDGFSAGWGAHFQPAEAYWVDCHTHMREENAGEMLDLVDSWGDRLDAWRLRRSVALDGSPANADAFAAAADDDRFAWLVWLDPDDPDLAGFERCLEAGVRGLKLHNRPVIQNALDPSVWYSEEWHRLFERLGEAERPALWHVTQRLTEAPYTGGGRNSYWEMGWENGAEFTNEDLLQSFLSVVEAHPDTAFVGAHQLHLGFDRLDDLLTAYPNLHIDTSIGCFVRWGDRMYPEDRDRAREFFIKWADRILFGTDCVLSGDQPGEHTYQQFLGHVRYIRQLRLPDDVLQRVSHGNAERLFGLPPADPEMKGTLRP